LAAVKLIGTVVLQSACGEEVVIRTEPLPLDDVGELNEPFTVIVAATPVDGVAVVESWNEFPVIGAAVSRAAVVKASEIPQTGPAYPTEKRTTALFDTMKLNAHR
jgi:hypothetical protein